MATAVPDSCTPTSDSGAYATESEQEHDGQELFELLGDFSLDLDKVATDNKDTPSPEDQDQGDNPAMANEDAQDNGQEDNNLTVENEYAPPGPGEDQDQDDMTWKNSSIPIEPIPFGHGHRAEFRPKDIATKLKFILPTGDNGIYLPNQPFIKWWQWMITVTSCLTYMLQIFIITMAFDLLEVWILLYILDLIYILDVFWININLAYVDKNGKLILDKNAIRKKYLRTRFVFDLVSVIPFEIGGIAFMGRPDFLKRLSHFRNIRLLRCYRPVYVLRK